jgi:hypothetical protein
MIVCAGARVSRIDSMPGQHPRHSPLEKAESSSQQDVP